MSNRYTDTKNASYGIRVRRGDRVQFTMVGSKMIHNNDDSDAAEYLEDGETYVGTVINESNAGFRGIEFSVETEDGDRASGISTGCIIEFLN